ncbi:MAG: SMP-30/gluconolactonase/LRE family protein [Dongiaceae bacterium]
MNGIRCIYETAAIAGESPVWSVDEQALYWIDVMAPAVHRFDPKTGENRSWKLPEQIGSIGLRKKGGLVAATKSGFSFIDVNNGRVTPIIDPERDLPENGFNDGKCDRRGRFWAGSAWLGSDGKYDNPPAEPTGSIYRLDPDHVCHRIVPGIRETNTFAWSPDDRTIYFGDSSESKVIYAADFDIEAGSIANQRIFARTNDGAGVHDGSAIDAEGYLWTTFWEGWRIVRYAPDGRIDRVVEMPFKYVTSCAFGGDNLETLFVTSGRWDLKGAELAAQPQAGSLFAFEPGVRGLPEPMFAG